MGYQLTSEAFDSVLQNLSEQYLIFAPKHFAAGGHFSDTELISYDEIKSISDVVFDKKSVHSFKEVLLPITQTLFYFTEEHVKEANPPVKGAIVFLRSCDLHAVKRLDEIYLHNGAQDYYYKRLRDNIHFVLLGCEKAFDNCFCVDMGTNCSENYDFSIDIKDGEYIVDCKNNEWQHLFEGAASQALEVKPAFVTETNIHVNIPAD